METIIDWVAHRLRVVAFVVISARIPSPWIMSPELYGITRELTAQESFARADMESWTTFSMLYR